MQKLLKKYREYKHRIATINWNISWEEENLYLQKLKYKREQMPQDGIYDSICQYKAQMYRVKKNEIYLLQLLSFTAFPLILLRGLLKRIKKSDKKDAAYFFGLEIFPTDILKGKTLIFIDAGDFKLIFSDIVFLWKIFVASPFNWILLSTVSFRIARIRYAIEKYGVTEVWTNMEFSCACGAVYDYCCQNKLILKNFMHGEKVLSLRDSFTRFHEFYLWNNHYKNIFETLLTGADSIIIANPLELKNKKTETLKTNKVCYFLSGENTEGEIKIIDNNLRTLKNKGFEIYYKKHPRQLDNFPLSVDYVEYLQFSEIENLYMFDYIISQFSTILFQCYSNNQAIIIDDMVNPEKVRQLQERNYIFLNKINDVPLLSSFV